MGYAATMNYVKSLAKQLFPKPTGRRHLDETVMKIGGKPMCLWRAPMTSSRC